MKIPLPGSAAILFALALAALSSCRESKESSNATGDSKPSARATPESTVNKAITMLKEERIAQFPALASLALALKRGDIPESGEGIHSVELADLRKVEQLLQAAKASSPRLIENGRVAIYKVPGYGLPRDELNLIRLRNNWYFVVE